MAEFMGNLRRTDYCGTFRIDSVGKEVVVMGWVQRRRNLGSLIFVDLRDRSGLLQIVFDDTTSDAVFRKAESIRSEYVIAVKGVVRERPTKSRRATLRFWRPSSEYSPRQIPLRLKYSTTRT